MTLALCTVTFDHSTQMYGNCSREETIQGRKLYEEIWYVLKMKEDMLLTFISCFQRFETVVTGTRIKDIEPVIDLLNEIGKSLHFEIIREESIDCLGCRKGQ